MNIPSFLPQRGWSRHTKGYVIFTSRKTGSICRGQYLHRAVLEKLGGPITPGLQVQHLWPFDKTDGSPHTLLLAPPEFNPSPARRCPYTGQFLSLGEYERRFRGSE